MVEASTWGRAGRRLRRIIFLVFFSSMVETTSVVFVEGTRVCVVFVVVWSVLVVSGGCETSRGKGEGGSIVEGMTDGSEVSTSVMLVS